MFGRQAASLPGGGWGPLNCGSCEVLKCASIRSFFCSCKGRDESYELPKFCVGGMVGCWIWRVLLSVRKPSHLRIWGGWEKESVGLFNKVRLEAGAFFVAARGWFISLKLGGGFPCCVLVCVVFSGMSECLLI